MKKFLASLALALVLISAVPMVASEGPEGPEVGGWWEAFIVWVGETLTRGGCSIDPLGCPMADEPPPPPPDNTQGGCTIDPNGCPRG